MSYINECFFPKMLCVGYGAVDSAGLACYSSHYKSCGMLLGHFLSNVLYN
jgi:hypothetical protein